MTKNLVERSENRCPDCGAKAVLGGVRLGKSLVDGCGACKKLWERETRGATTSEPCDNCAFRPGSPEYKDGRIWQIMRDTLEGPGVFYCHKRVPFEIKGGKHGGFEHQMDEAKRRCLNATVCAGWIMEKRRAKVHAT